MEEEGWWWLDCGVFLFFPMVGGCQLRSGGRGRLLGLLTAVVICGCGWWGNGGSGCCCCVVMAVVMVWFFFFPLLLRFLDLEFVGGVVVDVVVVVDRR